jgi:hypothetical protein
VCEESNLNIETPPVAHEHETSLLSLLAEAQHETSVLNSRLAEAEEHIADQHARLLRAEAQIAKLSRISNEKHVKVFDKGAISLFLLFVFVILLLIEGSLLRGGVIVYEIAYPYIIMFSRQIISVYTENLCPLAYATKAYIIRKSNALQNAWKLLKE